MITKNTEYDEIMFKLKNMKISLEEESKLVKIELNSCRTTFEKILSEKDKTIEEL